jgi:hypothetical protein
MLLRLIPGTDTDVDRQRHRTEVRQALDDDRNAAGCLSEVELILGHDP